MCFLLSERLVLMQCVCHGVACSPGAVKWSQLLKMFAGWVFTLFVGGIISAAIFAWGTYAPSKALGGEVLAYQNAIKGMTDAQLGALNAAATNSPAPATLSTINKSWAAMTQATKSHPWPSTTIPAADVTSLAAQTNTLLLQNSQVSFKP